MAETLRQLGLDRTRARKGAVRPELTPSQIRGLLADLGTGIGLPFIDAASQAAQGNYGQAAVSGLLDAPPVKMAGMALAPLIGMVKKSAPMDEALRIAQKNAAKPVSEGGLGLPKNNTPMDRARAMGFGDGWMHGTNKDFPAFKSGDTYMITDPSEASRYAEIASRTSGGANVIPLMTRGQTVGPKEYDSAYDALLKERGASYIPSKDVHTSLSKAGVAGYKEGDTQIIFNPANIRSRFAAFDPARINENNLLASLAALGISIPVMRGLLQEEEMQ